MYDVNGFFVCGQNNLVRRCYGSDGKESASKQLKLGHPTGHPIGRYLFVLYGLIHVEIDVEDEKKTD